MDRTEKNGKWLNLYDDCATMLEEGVNQTERVGGNYEKGKEIDCVAAGVGPVSERFAGGVLASETGAAEAVSPSVMAVTSGKCGKNVTWKLDGKGTLTISGKGAMYDYFAVAAPWEPANS